MSQIWQHSPCCFKGWCQDFSTTFHKTISEDLWNTGNTNRIISFNIHKIFYVSRSFSLFQFIGLSICIKACIILLLQWYQWAGVSQVWNTSSKLLTLISYCHSILFHFDPCKEIIVNQSKVILKPRALISYCHSILFHYDPCKEIIVNQSKV